MLRGSSDRDSSSRALRHVRMSGARQKSELGDVGAEYNFAQGAVSCPMQLLTLSLFRTGCGDYKSATEFYFLSTFVSKKYLANGLSVSVSTDWEMTVI